jgi:hydrogenase nickel incorporation protein HypA/HybF
MHEASIAISIIETVIRQCDDNGYNVVESIRLRIGKAAGVVIDSLIFAFDAAKQNTKASEARLIVEAVPLGGNCNSCMREFDSEARFVYCCPHCRSTEIMITRGHEMDIVDMEVE